MTTADGAALAAAAAVAAARHQGRRDLDLRARLVKADMLRRRGNVAEAGRQVQEIHRWAGIPRVRGPGAVRRGRTAAGG